MKRGDVDYVEILFENDELIAVNKPWDICINGDEEKCGPTVATLLQKKFPQLADSRVSYGFRFPHQLDYATSGALCIALTKEATRNISFLFKQRKVFKQYIALVGQHLCTNQIKPYPTPPPPPLPSAGDMWGFCC